MPDTSTGVKGWFTENAGLMKYLHMGLAGGGGAVVAMAAIDALKAQPGFMPQLIGGGAMYFGFAVVALVLFDRRAGKSAELQARNVAAQELLASNVGALVNRSSEREREQELMLNHLAAQYQEIIDGIGAIRQEIRKP